MNADGLVTLGLSMVLIAGFGLALVFIFTAISNDGDKEE